MSLCPTDRYIILRGGVPVHTTERLGAVAIYLWRRDIKDRYCVLDYEQPYVWDHPNLLEWIMGLVDAPRRPLTLEKRGV